ncbi:hypothetical protein MHYP_G00270070 [Metynnis hypsauchen]
MQLQFANSGSITIIRWTLCSSPGEELDILLHAYLPFSQGDGERPTEEGDGALDRGHSDDDANQRCSERER